MVSSGMAAEAIPVIPFAHVTLDPPEDAAAAAPALAVAAAARVADRITLGQGGNGVVRPATLADGQRVVVKVCSGLNPRQTLISHSVFAFSTRHYIRWRTQICLV